jgi:phosphohistidine phosphatase SixA
MGVSVSLSGSAAAADQYAPPPNVLDGRALVAALRAGGYVLYFRHGITDHSIDDTDRVNLTNCATQRPLSEAGRKQMRATGKAIKALGIRISAVFSSPFCRAKESARLAFGDAVTLVDDLGQGVDDDQATAKRRAQALRKMLATLPGVAGTNTVITSHTGNLQDAAGIWPEPEGVAIIFKPGGDGKFSFIATVLPAQWQTWMRAKTKSADR